MRNRKVFMWVVASFFTALTCAATVMIRVPLPNGGYVNLGDCMVLLSGFLLGPAFGAVAAGIGSMLADILSGYVPYAPGTLIIKSLMALTASLLYLSILKGAIFTKHKILSMAAAGCAAETVMVAGYFVYESLIIGIGLAAAANIPGNLFQAAFGIITAVYLTPFLERIPFIRDRLLQFRTKENKIS